MITYLKIVITIYLKWLRVTIVFYQQYLLAMIKYLIELFQILI